VRLHAQLVSACIVRYAFSWEEARGQESCWENARGKEQFVLNILQERVDGELWDALTATDAPPSSDDERLRWSAQLLSGVHHLHARDTVHRDISP